MSAQGDQGEGLEDAVENLAHALAETGIGGAGELAAACWRLPISASTLGASSKRRRNAAMQSLRDAQVDVHVDHDLAPGALHAGADGVAFATLRTRLSIT